LTYKQLAELADAELATVKEAVAQLSKDYADPERGMMVQQAGGSVSFATAGQNSKLIAQFIKSETTGELTRAALETLTIISYRGPVARAEIEQIRGVNCAIMIRTLLIRGLISSRQDKPKAAPLYEVTHDFLRYLGLRQTAELPDYEKLNSSENLTKLLNQNQVGSAGLSER